MIGPTDLLHPSPAPHFKTFQVFLIYGPKRPSLSTIKRALFLLITFTGDGKYLPADSHKSPKRKTRIFHHGVLREKF
jgi:hypothetical protein